MPLGRHHVCRPGVPRLPSLPLAWPAWMAAVLCAGAVVGCSANAENHALVVNLRTDLVPIEEFDGAEFILSRADGEEGGLRMEVGLQEAIYLPGARLGEVTELTEGDYRLDVQLLDSDTGRVVARHPVLIDLRESLSVTVPIDRSCLNVACPPVDDPETPEDESTHIACLGGQCVDARCTLETPEFCGDDILCGADSDCQPEAGCATGECVLGVCWARAKQAGEEGACEGDTEWCHPESSCLPEGQNPADETNCFDGVQNGFESGIDCGFPCEPCEGEREHETDASCTNNRLDEGEGAIDCGGRCVPCSSDFDCEVQSSIPIYECRALVAFFEGTGGSTQWSQNEDWLESTDPCTWQGIVCQGGHVTEVDLPENRVTGPFVPALCNLSELRVLDLTENSVSGALPESIGELHALEELRMQGNSLAGTLPESVGQMTALRILYVSWNGIFGTLPASLGSLRQLRELRTNNNSFSGTLPESLGDIASLEILQVADNRLEGTLPSSLGSTSLRELSLHQNDFTGTIPANFGNLTGLQLFEAYENRLTGAIPEGLAGLGSLRRVWLGDNQLSGTIPEAFGDNPNLESLRLYGNALTGTIPARLVDPPRLTWLDLQRNALSGTIPDAFVVLEGRAATRVQFNNNTCLTSENAELVDYLDLVDPEWRGACP